MSKKTAAISPPCLTAHVCRLRPPHCPHMHPVRRGRMDQVSVCGEPQLGAHVPWVGCTVAPHSSRCIGRWRCCGRRRVVMSHCNSPWWTAHIYAACRSPSVGMMTRRKICAAYILKQRATRQSILLRVAAIVAAQVCVAEEDLADSPPTERRCIVRALGKWRGSTLSGYVNHGDEITYRANFRCTEETLKAVCELLSKSPLNPKRVSSVPSSRNAKQHAKG